MATSETLSTRYIAAVLGGVPVSQRHEVEATLRNTIALAIDDRVAKGESADSAERAVLVEFGDPMRVSARFTHRQLYLIGPQVYPGYIRLVKLLLGIVVPIITIVVGVSMAIAGASIWNIALSAVGSGFAVGVQLTFWITVVFVILDRTDRVSVAKALEWDLDDLPEFPELPDRDIGMGDTVASIIGLSLLAAFLLWQPGYQEPFDTASPPIPIIDPRLSTLWIPVLVVVLLASIALEIIKYRVGQWTVPLAVINTLLNLAFAIPAIWLIASDQLLNPEFVSAIASGGFQDLVELLSTVISWVIGVGAVASIASGWWRVLRNGPRSSAEAISEGVRRVG